MPKLFTDFNRIMRAGRRMPTASSAAMTLLMLDVTER
jgi:hypothetical protein